MTLPAPGKSTKCVPPPPSALTPQRIISVPCHRGTMMLWPVPFDCNQGNMHPDRDKLTVDKKGPELVCSGPARCLGRSLCGHHAPVDIVLTTDDWMETPALPTFPKTCFPRSRGRCCRGPTTLESTAIAGGVLQGPQT
jgi:hypothetical protein